MPRLNNKRSGMLLLDLITSLTIIWFIIWLFGGIISMLARNAQETALRYQLNNFRMVLMLYKELKGQYPPDLKVLVQTDYNVIKGSKDVLNAEPLLDFRQDTRGEVLDAFGNRLYYDPQKGVILSQTKGFENW